MALGLTWSTDYAGSANPNADTQYMDGCSVWVDIDGSMDHVYFNENTGSTDGGLCHAAGSAAGNDGTCYHRPICVKPLKGEWILQPGYEFMFTRLDTTGNARYNSLPVLGDIYAFPSTASQQMRSCITKIFKWSATLTLQSLCS